MLLLGFLPTKSHAQADSALVWERTWEGQFSYFNIDNLHNLYQIDGLNQLKKRNAQGDSMGVFNDVRQFGQLNTLDATNPLKLLLYYPQYATILVLDRFLNKRNSINLRQQDIFRVKTIATSYDNQIWIYDEGDAKLKKIGDNGEVLLESADLRNAMDTVPNPSLILDRDGLLYLYDDNKGFFVFDYYGAFKIRYPLPGWSNCSILGKTLYGFQSGSLLRFDTETQILQETHLPAAFEQYHQIKVGNQKLFALSDSGIVQYLVK